MLFFSNKSRTSLGSNSVAESISLISLFIKRSMTPFLESFDAYGIGVWLSNHKELNISLMSGHQGQYVIMIPEKDLIITRLGERDIDLGGPGVSGDVLVYIDEALSLIQD